MTVSVLTQATLREMTATSTEVLPLTPPKPRVFDQRMAKRSGQAEALALLLEQEFGAGFTFYDQLTKGLLYPRVTGDASICTPPLLSEKLDLKRLAQQGGIAVADTEPSFLDLMVMLPEQGGDGFVALAQIPSLTQGTARQHELTRLSRWAQAVRDRFCLTNALLVHQHQVEERNSQVVLAWQALLSLDELLHSVRIRTDPTRGQQRILETVLPLLGAESLAWVPHSVLLPIVSIGTTKLGQMDYRLLGSLLNTLPREKATDPLICNDFKLVSWSGQFPQLSSLLALPVLAQETLGWMIALNKLPVLAKSQELTLEPKHGLFRKTDAALITPFVSLLGFNLHSVQRFREIKELLVSLIQSLIAALDAKDSYTSGHSERVARIAVELGRELGKSPEELHDIYLVGLLHDVGKIGIRDAVLCKTEPLTLEELEHIKEHVKIGCAILADLKPLRSLLPGVMHHHENYDGTGYPDGQVGTEIPELARLLAVADAYDAMSTTRPYREALPLRTVEQILTEGAGKQWDPKVIAAFTRCRQRIHVIRRQGTGDSIHIAFDNALELHNQEVLAAERTATEEKLSW